MGEVSVSVCIPVYNGEKFISEAIDSVLSQTFQDFEILIVDNCSTDQTLDVVARYKDKRIRVLRNESNLGMLGNWNKILTQATGKYIKLLPADDTISRDCLSLQVAVLDKDHKEQISLVCGRKNVVKGNGKILFSRGFSRTDKKVNGIAAINKTVRSGGNIIGEPGVVLFRRSILEKTGLFDASIYYAIDIYLWFKMLLHGDLYSLGSVVNNFRVSTESESVRIIGQQKSDLLSFYKKLYGQREFGLTQTSYRIGQASVSISTMAKKIIYKLFV